MPDPQTAVSPLAPHRASPAELKEQLDADRDGMPFLLYRDGSDRQRILRLDAVAGPLTIGRRAANDIALEWDVQVSRVHAQIQRLGDEWAVADDGLSTNGTFVNGTRIRGRRRLHDRDEVRCGSTVIAFRAPTRGTSKTTAMTDEFRDLPRLNDTQRAVLIALARPYKDSRGFVTPASNKEIAAELVMSVDGVKSALRALFQKFEVGDLPQKEKRARLAERAFQLGVITTDNL